MEVLLQINSRLHLRDSSNESDKVLCFLWQRAYLEKSILVTLKFCDHLEDIHKHAVDHLLLNLDLHVSGTKRIPPRHIIKDNLRKNFPNR